MNNFIANGCRAPKPISLESVLKSRLFEESSKRGRFEKHVLKGGGGVMVTES